MWLKKLGSAGWGNFSVEQSQSLALSAVVVDIEENYGLDYTMTKCHRLFTVVIERGCTPVRRLTSLPSSYLLTAACLDLDDIVLPYRQVTIFNRCIRKILVEAANLSVEEKALWAGGKHVPIKLDRLHLPTD